MYIESIGKYIDVRIYIYYIYTGCPKNKCMHRLTCRNFPMKSFFSGRLCANKNCRYNRSNRVYILLGHPLYTYIHIVVHSKVTNRWNEKYKSEAT